MNKVRVFAAFKDFYDEEFTMPENIQNVLELKAALLKLNPQARELLETARFAVDHEFIDVNHKLSGNEHIFIIPPSGGG